MKGHVLQWVGLLVGILVAVPGLPYLAGLLGFWVYFFRVFGINLSTAWNAALLVPRSQTLQYGVEILWPYVPLAVSLTGVILMYWTLTRHYRNHNAREQRWRTWGLGLFLQAVAFITWWVNWSFTAIVIAVPITIVAVFVYVFWRVSRDERRQGEQPTYPAVLYVGLVVLYVGFFAIAFTNAPATHAPLDYLVDTHKWEVKGQATGLSEDRWYFFTCDGDYTSTPDEEYYRRFPPMSMSEFYDAIGSQDPLERKSLLYRVYNPHVPEQYADFCANGGGKILKVLSGN